MSERHPSEQGDAPSAFEREAQRAALGFFREMTGFLRQSRKWWLVPVLLALVTVGVFVVLAETAVAPFIYALF